MIVIEDAGVHDAADILALQKLAYQSEAALYNDYSIPPLTQTLEELVAEFQHSLFLKAVQDGRIVGSVRATLQDGTCAIGRLIVHPDAQGRGLGTRLMGAIEERFGHADRYELFTGQQSARNLHLYRKLGYRVFREKRLSERVMIVYLEKPARQGAVPGATGEPSDT